MRTALAAVALGALLPACVPELDDRSFTVTGPSLLAIASTPAEAAPPASVSYSALYVDQNGPRTADLSWAFCVARRALTDPGSVSPECLEPSGSGLTPLGAGVTVSGALPSDACRLFGPDSPDVVAGMPAGRPVDPDITGGFYQPVRLLAEDPGASYSIGATRIACGLAGGTATLASAFAASYRYNENPALDTLSLVRPGSDPMKAPVIKPDTAAGTPGATVMAGESVTLHATWDACPTPVGCTGSEQYVVLDPTTGTLVSAQEVITVAWYATGGTLTYDTSGPPPGSTGVTSLDNPWIAPTTTGTVWLWLVIRDDRGGVGFRSYQVEVQ